MHDNTPQEYEFSELQKRSIQTLVKTMRIASWLWIISGVVYSLEILLPLFRFGTLSISSTGLFGVIAIAIGAVILKTASSFQRIIDHEGNQIGNLMKALRHLKNLFVLNISLLILLLLLLLVGAVMVVMLQPPPPPPP